MEELNFMKAEIRKNQERQKVNIFFFQLCFLFSIWKIK